jgi:hypothetical protein
VSCRSPPAMQRRQQIRLGPAGSRAFHRRRFRQPSQSRVGADDLTACTAVAGRATDGPQHYRPQCADTSQGNYPDVRIRHRPSSARVHRGIPRAHARPWPRQAASGASFSIQKHDAYSGVREAMERASQLPVAQATLRDEGGIRRGGSGGRYPVAGRRYPVQSGCESRSAEGGRG